jgi:CDP-diacylglycerol--glycerol-3-phosphate 3-phosphatidyltransferase
MVTEFGKLADPIADKLLIGSALIGLSVLGDLPWWVTVVILIREIGITLLRMWVIRIGVIPASRGGKAKTVAQMVAITMLLAPVTATWWVLLSYGVMAIAVILTVVTGWDYVARVMRLRARA